MKNGIGLWDWICGARTQNFSTPQIIKLTELSIIDRTEARAFIRLAVPYSDKFLYAKSKEGYEL